MLASRIGFIALLLAVAVPASAVPPYDGSKPMQCAIQSVMVCSDPSVCVRGTAATIDLRAVLSVDVGQRVIGGATAGRTIQITSVNHVGGRLLLSGTESGGTWTMAVIEDSGDMTSTVIPRNGGFLMFGSCSSK
jgi:hypothetical protein